MEHNISKSYDKPAAKTKQRRLLAELVNNQIVSLVGWAELERTAEKQDFALPTLQVFLFL